MCYERRNSRYNILYCKKLTSTPIDSKEAVISKEIHEQQIEAVRKQRNDYHQQVIKLENEVRFLKHQLTLTRPSQKGY